MTNMKIINIEAIKRLLNDNSISAYKIGKESGMPRQNISALRRGDIDLDNVSLKSLKQLQSYVNNHPETLD